MPSKAKKKTEKKLREEAMDLIRSRPIKAIFGTEVETFDYTKLSKVERRAYCDEAKRLNTSTVILNEYKKMYNDLRHRALLEALSYDELLILRHQFQGVKDFLDRIGMIVFADEKKETKDDLYSEL